MFALHTYFLVCRSGRLTCYLQWSFRENLRRDCKRCSLCVNIICLLVLFLLIIPRVSFQCQPTLKLFQGVEGIVERIYYSMGKLYIKICFHIHSRLTVCRLRNLVVTTWSNITLWNLRVASRLVFRQESR